MRPKPFYFYCPDCGRVDSQVIVPRNPPQECLICAHCRKGHVQVIGVTSDGDLDVTEEEMLADIESRLTIWKARP